LIAGTIFLADLLIGAVLIPARLSALGIVGDFLLVEVGLLTILGGLVEFSRSKGVYEIRRITLLSKEEFSTTKHDEASRRALVLFSAALTLFVLLLILTLIESQFQTLR
jgi:hypothetical protein